MKRCTKCGKDKQLYQFYRDASQSTGRRPECQSCNTRKSKRNPTRQVWHDMRARCYNKRNAYYMLYGGRGIKICSRWLESFDNFLADMGDRPEGRSIDRVDNNGNYEPSNCRWATPSEQNSNKRVKDPNRLCIIESCEQKVLAKNLCSKHYQRARK